MKNWSIALAAALLAVITLAKPTLTQERNVYRYFAVFDITQSQNAEDYVLDGKAISRLAFAKHAMRAALRDLPCGSSVGVGLFAAYDISAYYGNDDMGYQPMSREAAVIAPLFAPVEVCRNFFAIDRAIEAVDWRMAWNDSSDIAGGLSAAIKKAKAFDDGTGVVFFTEGEQVPSISYVPSFPGKKGEVKGLIVGTGDLAPALIPRFDGMGNRKGFLKERSRLDEDYLKKLAAETGLTYMRLGSAKQFSAALQAQEFARREKVDADIRLPLAALALLFVLLAVLF